VCGWSFEAVDIPSKSVILWPSNGFQYSRCVNI